MTPKYIEDAMAEDHQNGTGFYSDRLAKEAYQHHKDNHPLNHDNRFPSWEELPEGSKNVWRHQVAKPAPLDLTDLQPALDKIIYVKGVTTEDRVEAVMALISQEVTRAMKKWPPITDSLHHHFGVLKEEVEELWDEVTADNVRLAREEALQVAAMAIRFILEADLPKHKRKPSEAPKPRATCVGCGSHPPYHRVGCPAYSDAH